MSEREKYNSFDIPLLPEKLRQAKEENRLAVFIGAGVSRLLGCMGWDQLAENLIETCRKEDLINFFESKRLGQNRSQKQIISTCFEVLKNGSKLDKFYDELDKSLTPSDEYLKKGRKRNIYDDLFEIGDVFFTTNADMLMHRKFKNGKVIYGEDKLVKDNIKSGNLYHIHGYKKCRKSLVFTVEQYINRYRKDSEFNNFLRNVFDKYTVLFVGYGLNEMELLEHVFNSDSSMKEIRHYILNPFYKHETNIINYENMYFSKLGIECIPYFFDELGYGFLKDVVMHWNRVLNIPGRDLYDKFTRLKTIVSSPFNESLYLETIKIIREKSVLEMRFFMYLADTHHAIDWFHRLNTDNYFSIKNLPKPILNKNKQNKTISWKYDAVPFSNYLLRVAKSANDDKKKYMEISKDLLGFADDYWSCNEKTKYDNASLTTFIINLIITFDLDILGEKFVDILFVILIKNINHYFLKELLLENMFPKIFESNNYNYIKKTFDFLLFYKREKKKLLFDYNANNYYYENIPINDERDFHEIVNFISRKVENKHRIELIKFISHEIERKVKREEFSVTSFGRTVEEHEQSFSSHCAERYYLISLRELMINCEDDIFDIIKDMLNSVSPLVRIAIYIMNNMYSKYKVLFWDHKENLLKDYSNYHELHELFSSNVNSFSEEQLKKIYSMIIESIDCKKYNDNHRAYRIKKWLEALKSSSSKFISERYEEICQEYPESIMFPELTSWVMDAEDYKSEDIYLTLSDLPFNEKISQYMNHYSKNQNDDYENWDLKVTFRREISNNLDEYVSKIKELEILPPDLFRIFIEELGTNYDTLNSQYKENCLHYINEIIEKIYDSEFINSYHVNAICNFLGKIIQDDYVFAEEKTRNQVRATINNFHDKLLILNMLEEKYEFYGGNNLTSILEVKLNFSLKMKHKHSTIEEEMIEEFELGLHSDKLEYKYFISRHFRNFQYIDDQWIYSKLDRIFSFNNENDLKNTICNYIQESYVLDEKVFKYFKDKNLLEEFILLYDNNDRLGNVTKNLGFLIFFHYYKGIIEEVYLKSLIKSMISHPNNVLRGFIEAGVSKQVTLELDENKLKTIYIDTCEQINIVIENIDIIRHIDNLICWIGNFEKLDEDIFRSTSYLINHFELRYSYKVFEVFFKLFDKNREYTFLLVKSFITKNCDTLVSSKKIEFLVKMYESGYTEMANELWELLTLKGHMIDHVFEENNDLAN